MVTPSWPVSQSVSIFSLKIDELYPDSVGSYAAVSPVSILQVRSNVNIALVCIPLLLPYLVYVEKIL